MLQITVDDDVTKFLQGAPTALTQAIDNVVRDTTRTVFFRIDRATPRDRGTAASGWTEVVEGQGVRARRTFVNQTPYINVLEFGGYPVVWERWQRNPVTSAIKRGQAWLGGGYPPGPRTQESLGDDPTMRNNVSRQAPRGMVRDQLAKAEPEFVFNLEEALDRVLAAGEAAGAGR